MRTLVRIPLVSAFILLLMAWMPGLVLGQTVYQGNQNTGFGGVIGTGNFSVSDDGTTITLVFTRGGTALGMNDNVVIYIDSETGGVSSTANLTDFADGGRRAVSGLGNGGGARSTVAFPTGFQADYAISIDNSFIGLFEIVESGSHNFVADATNDISDPVWTVQFTFANIGANTSKRFKFVATHMNNTNAFRSNEAIGLSDAGGSNVGNGTLTFSSYRNYPFSVEVNGTAGTGQDAGWRMLGSPDASFARSDIGGVTFAMADNDEARTYDQGAGTGNARWVEVASAGTFSAGTGFILYLYDDATDEVGTEFYLDFANMSEIIANQQVTGLDTNEDFFLLGNPFFDAFDLSSLNLTGQGFNANVQIWDDTQNGGVGSYTTVTQAGDATDVIAVGQGFFIQRTTTNVGQDNVTFDAAGRTSGGSFVGGKRSATPRIGLTLEGIDASGNAVYDQAATIYFRPEAAHGWDAYDASKLKPLSSIYATVAMVDKREGEDEALAVASYPDLLTQPLLIPLQVDGAGYTGDLTLAWPTFENLPETWHITLIDHESAQEFDLRTVESLRFSFTSPSGKRDVLADGLVMKASATAERFTLRIDPGISTANELDPTVPQQIALEAAYPNPFNPTTSVRFALPQTGDATVAVYDALGRQVTTLANGTHRAGWHEVSWNATGQASGVYLIRLVAGATVQTQTVTLLK